MRIIVLLVLFLFPFLAQAQDSKISKTILDNGLTILVDPMSTSKSAGLYALVKTGSVNEADCMGCGLSHFVEHMLFKGTLKRKSGEIPKEVKKMGGVINAQTSFDDTVYTLDVPVENWRQGLDLIADMLFNAEFDSQEVERERLVIHGEMRLYQDQPARKLNELVFKSVYIRHPYRHPIIGYKLLFDQVSRNQLFDFYKQHYVPNNIILSIAGDVNPDEVIAFASKLFGEIKPKPVIERTLPMEQEVIIPRKVIEQYPTQLVHVSYSFASIPLLNNDLYALDLLAKAMGEGTSSLLYQQLYQKKRLVESVSAGNFTPADQGIFEIELLLKENNIDAVIKEINSILEEVMKKGLETRQFVRTKKKMLVDYYFYNQRASQRAYRNAHDQAATSDVQFSKHYVDGMNALQNEDIKRVARKYLDKNRSILVALIPKTDTLEKIVTQSPAQEISELIQLKNGITLILKPDLNVGVFSIIASFRGGIREETKENNGISQLFTRCWLRSSKRWPNEVLLKYLEREGISIMTSLTRNSIYMRANGIEGDDAKALDVMVDLIRNVKFDKDVMEQKKKDIQNNLISQQDQIQTIVFLDLLQRFFGKHAYGFNELGNVENLEKIKLNDLKEYYQHYIQPSNLVITMTGNFNSQYVKKHILDTLGSWQGQKVDLNPTPEITTAQPGSFPLLINKEQAMIAWAFPAPTIYGDDKYTMDLMDGLLGSGLGGRLYNKIREEFGQAYTLGADFSPGLDAGVFTIYVLTTEDKLHHVKSSVERELSLLRDQPISADELSSLKNYLKGRRQMTLDTPSAMATVMAFDQLYGLGFENYKDYQKHVDQVNVSDIQKAAKQYLDSSKAVVVVTHTKKSVE